ncbi:substrate-binding domain-containing protein [Mesobacillus maritimus]|nr:substrate-binding domain-containing protein [Mesobacillus maritimus]
MSNVGFDDSLLAEASEIKLTSVKHPKEEMGQDAAKWIVNAIENGPSNDVPSSIIYEPELVIRSSTAARKKSESESLLT